MQLAPANWPNSRNWSGWWCLTSFLPGTPRVSQLLHHLRVHHQILSLARSRSSSSSSNSRSSDKLGLLRLIISGSCTPTTLGSTSRSVSSTSLKNTFTVGGTC